MPPPPPGQHARLAPLVSPIPRTTANFTPRFHSTTSPPLTSSNDRSVPVTHSSTLPTQQPFSLPHPQSRQTSGPRVIQALDPSLANPVRITPVNFRVPREMRSSNASPSPEAYGASSVREPQPRVNPSIPLNKRPSTRDGKWASMSPTPRSATPAASHSTRDHFASSTVASPTAQAATAFQQSVPSQSTSRPTPHTRIPPRTHFIFSHSTPSPNYTSPLSATNSSSRPSPLSFSPAAHEHLPFNVAADGHASFKPLVQEVPVKVPESHRTSTRKLTLQTGPEILNASQRPILVEIRSENTASQLPNQHLGEPVRSPPLPAYRTSSPAPISATSPSSPAIPRPSFKLDWEAKWDEAKKRWDEEDRRIREDFNRTAQNTQTGFKARSDSPSPSNVSSSNGRQTPKYQWHRPVNNVLGNSRTMQHTRAHSDPRPRPAPPIDSSYLSSDVTEDNSSEGSTRTASYSSSSSFDSQSSFTSASSSEWQQPPRLRSNTGPSRPQTRPTSSEGGSDEKLWERLLAALDDMWDGDRTRVDPRVGKAWESYETRWHSLSTQPSTTPLTFADIPWPVSLAVIPTPEHLAQTLTVRNIRSFLLSPTHSKEKSKRERLRSALLRWHCDKFEGKWMSRVLEEDRPAVKEAVGLVSRSLNELMAGLSDA